MNRFLIFSLFIFFSVSTVFATGITIEQNTNIDNFTYTNTHITFNNSNLTINDGKHSLMNSGLSFINSIININGSINEYGELSNKIYSLDANNSTINFNGNTLSNVQSIMLNNNSTLNFANSKVSRSIRFDLDSNIILQNNSSMTTDKTSYINFAGDAYISIVDKSKLNSDSKVTWTIFATDTTERTFQLNVSKTSSAYIKEIRIEDNNFSGTMGHNFNIVSDSKDTNIGLIYFKYSLLNVKFIGSSTINTFMFANTSGQVLSNGLNFHDAKVVFSEGGDLYGRIPTFNLTGNSVVEINGGLNLDNTTFNIEAKSSLIIDASKYNDSFFQTKFAVNNKGKFSLQANNFNDAPYNISNINNTGYIFYLFANKIDNINNSGNIILLANSTDVGILNNTDNLTVRDASEYFGNINTNKIGTIDTLNNSNDLHLMGKVNINTLNNTNGNVYFYKNKDTIFNVKEINNNAYISVQTIVNTEKINNTGKINLELSYTNRPLVIVDNSKNTSNTGIINLGISKSVGATINYYALKPNSINKYTLLSLVNANNTQGDRNNLNTYNWNDIGHITLGNGATDTADECGCTPIYNVIDQTSNGILQQNVVAEINRKVNLLSNLNNTTGAISTIKKNTLEYTTLELLNDIASNKHGEITDSALDIINVFDELNRELNNANTYIKYDLKNLTKAEIEHKFVDSINSMKPINNEIFLISANSNANYYYNDLLKENLNNKTTKTWFNYSFNSQTSDDTISNSNIVASKNKTNTLQYGFNYVFTNEFFAAVTIGANFGDVKSNNGLYESDVLGFAGGILANYDFNMFNLSLGGLYNYNTYTTKRDMPMFNSNAVITNVGKTNNESKQKTSTTVLATNVSKAINIGNHYVLSPIAGIKYTNIVLNDYNESGSSGALSVEGFSANILDFSTGINSFITYNVKKSNNKFYVDAIIGYIKSGYTNTNYALLDYKNNKTQYTGVGLNNVYYTASVGNLSTFNNFELGLGYNIKLENNKYKTFNHKFNVSASYKL